MNSPHFLNSPGPVARFTDWHGENLPASVKALSPKLRNLKSLQDNFATTGTTGHDPKLIYVLPHYRVEQVRKAIELSDLGCTHVMVHGSTVRGFVPIDAPGLRDKKYRLRRCYIRFALELRADHREGPTLDDLAREAS